MKGRSRFHLGILGTGISGVIWDILAIKLAYEAPWSSKKPAIPTP